MAFFTAFKISNMNGLELLASSIQEAEATEGSLPTLPSISTDGNLPTLPSISSIMNSQEASKPKQIHIKPHNSILPSMDSIINKTQLNIPEQLHSSPIVTPYKEQVYPLPEKVEESLTLRVSENSLMFHPYTHDKKKEVLFNIPKMPNDAFKMVMTDDGPIYQCTFPNCKRSNLV